MTLIRFLLWDPLPDLLAQLTNKYWAFPGGWCEEWEERNHIYFRRTLETLTLVCVHLSSQFHELMLKTISGYCEGGGQCEGASGIQPRQMVGKQISRQTSTGNSPFFGRQICPPRLIPSTAAPLMAWRHIK